MSSTDRRNTVFILAATEFDTAYAEARQIKNPWFRAQALAAVLRYAPQDKIPILAKEAFAAARACKDAYQQVSVTAWAVRALIERDAQKVLKPFLMEVLANVRNITPAPSQVEAVFNLWSALWIAPSLREPTFAMLLQICETANTWRAGRAMRTIVSIVVAEDRVWAEAVWNRMPENRYKRQARRALDATQTDTVRAYFRS